jgi:transposase-like protein
MTRDRPCAIITTNMPAPAPPELRARAIARAQEIGVTDAAEEVGVSKAAVSRWCSNAGVVTVPNERTRAAIAAHSANAEARKSALVDQLLVVAEAGGQRELELIAHADLRDVVGARTRAIHDAQLLSGAATSRSEHTSGLDAEIERLTEKLTK